MKRLFLCILCTAMLVSGPSYAAQGAARSGAAQHMLTPEFWISRTAKHDKIIMDKDEISAFTEEIRRTKETHCVDVLSLPVMLTSEQLTGYIKTFAFPAEDRYIGSRKADADYYALLDAQHNTAAVRDLNIVRFGVATKETPIRVFPTSDPSYTEQDDVQFDMNAESIVKVWEPLAILHVSRDGQWLLARSPSVLGWVQVGDVAIIDRKALRQYLSRDCVVVTGNRILLAENHTSLGMGTELTMGTRLPLADSAEGVDGVTTDYSRAVILPGRDKDGNFIERTARVPLHCDASGGYLPYTRANIIRQAFKMLGERYGWGGFMGNRDCSSFIQDIYLTFGISLPRNSRSQTKIPSAHFDTKDMPTDEKELLILSQPTGTLLQMPGHIILYLGKVRGKPYVIHDAYAYDESGLGGKEERLHINCVAVTDLQITRKDGTPFLNAIHNINVIKAKEQN